MPVIDSHAVESGTAEEASARRLRLPEIFVTGRDVTLVTSDVAIAASAAGCLIACVALRPS